MRQSGENVPCGLWQSVHCTTPSFTRCLKGMANWARTGRRRFIWRHMEVGGSPLEYTGTGGELFVGYLKLAAAYIVLLGIPSRGVPLAQISVPIAGIIAMLGGLSVLIGYRVRLGALLIIVFLIPVTLAMHDFWAVADPAMAQMQMAMFLKNVSMLGGALLIAYFGAGPVSADERAAKRHG